MDSNTYEATLENMIMDNIGFCQLRGFPEVYNKTNRQFRLPTGKICDLFSYELNNNSLNCKIFELKRGELGVSALLQVIEYGIDAAKYSSWSFENVNIELYLIGSEINDEMLNLIGWGVNVKVLTYEYRFDGIHFQPLTVPGNYPPPYWVKRPHEMMGKPNDDDISSWVNKLKS